MHSLLPATTDLEPREPKTVRSLLALAMMLAPWGFVLANSAYMLAIRDGGNEDTSLDTLALYAAHPELVRVAVVSGLVACLLIIPAVLGLFRLAPSNRLVRVGGSMMIAGYVCYFAILQGSLTTLAMALQGEPQRFAEALDSAQGEVAGIAVFAVFALGNIVGTLLLAMGLLRSRSVPRWAAIGILLWPVLHVVGLVFFPNEVPQVIAAITQALGFGGCALLLRRR